MLRTVGRRRRRGRIAFFSVFTFYALLYTYLYIIRMPERGRQTAYTYIYTHYIYIYRFVSRRGVSCDDNDGTGLGEERWWERRGGPLLASAGLAGDLNFVWCEPTTPPPFCSSDRLLLYTADRSFPSVIIIIIIIIYKSIYTRTRAHTTAAVSRDRVSIPYVRLKKWLLLSYVCVCINRLEHNE